MDELYQTSFPPKQTVIDGLLYAGTYLLAGAPKIGKSYLALQIAYHVSKGILLWGREVHQGTVLYLALEDTKERLQLRLYRMFGVESTSHLKMSIACKPLGKGLAQQLQAFIEDYPDVRLIIIDTLQRIRDDGGDAYNYGKDYEIIQKIKAISDDRNICILMVHHTRKKQASNKFDMISGTNGLFGAADGAMILTVDERTKAEARMDVAGRDQQDQRIYLKREQQR